MIRGSRGAFSAHTANRDSVHLSFDVVCIYVYSALDTLGFHTSALCSVKQPRSVREERLMKELCGWSGIMGYVTFHRTTRPAVYSFPLTWETAAVMFLTVARTIEIKPSHECLIQGGRYSVLQLFFYEHGSDTSTRDLFIPFFQRRTSKFPFSDNH